MHLPASADDAELALDELRRLVQGLRTSSHAVERDLGISGAQLFVLRELAAEPGASIRRLSERTLTDPSSVSTVVARLVESGFVIRSQSTTDGRATSLSVSKSGSRLLARAPEPYQARIIAALRQQPRARLRAFRQALTTVVDALQIERGAAPLFFEAVPSADQRKRRAARR